MSITRILDPKALAPLHVVLICLVAATVAGGSWFLSAAESKTLVDGAVEWRVDSPLRAVVSLLCLGYAFPTIHAGAVKVYILGLGAGLALLAVALAILVGGRSGDQDSTEGDFVVADPDSGSAPAKSHFAPLTAAQLLAVMYLLWSFASSRWSAAPEFAVGGSVLLSIFFLWALALGNGMNVYAARLTSWIIVGVTGVTAVVAIWYFYGRNPAIRAKFPFGNPNFLSACLVPGLLLGGTWACGAIGGLKRGWSPRAFAALVVSLAVIALGLWAFVLAGSRGPALGLVVGTLAVLFFALRGWGKLLPLVLVLALASFSWFYYSSVKDAEAPGGRSTSLRFRTYAWGYAWQMFTEKPWTGHGQGGFVLGGDTHAVDDVLDDPLVFRARIAHAHNEWLEVMADLGMVGLVLLGASLALTLRAGALALRERKAGEDRWALLGLMGALVGLVIEETFGVGLRVSGVPTLFYTVVGLIWAMSGRSPGLVDRLSARHGCRVVCGSASVVFALAILVNAQLDFWDARNAYQAEQAIETGDYDEAIRLAGAARSRLNPQRALSGFYRLSEAHMLAARKLQGRAADREARAGGDDLADQKLVALAQMDRDLSEQHCVAGSLALKELVQRSPGYLNHGHVEYWLNIVRADNAAARNDHEGRQLALRNAVAAIQREVKRQPFSPATAIDLARVMGFGVDAAGKLEVLARSLRYNRITARYVEVLLALMTEPEFERQFFELTGKAREALVSPGEGAPDTEPVLVWSPEVLRLAATVHFQRGEFAQAADVLSVAANAYEALATRAPLGAASCFAELADCQFYADWRNPGPAISSAERARTLAPSSWRGRDLREGLNERLIDFYLAAGRETDARDLLRETATQQVTEEMVLAELALRYRGMVDGLLRRESAAAEGPLPVEHLDAYQAWIERSIVMNADDSVCRLILAELAFLRGDSNGAADYLVEGLRHGLTVDLAMEFLEAARSRDPQNAALKELWDSLNPKAPEPPEKSDTSAGAESLLKALKSSKRD